jgi:hypothetical protein
MANRKGCNDQILTACWILDDDQIPHCPRTDKGRVIAFCGVGLLTYARLPRLSHISSTLDGVTDIRMTDFTFVMITEM